MPIDGIKIVQAVMEGSRIGMPKGSSPLSASIFPSFLSIIITNSPFNLKRSGETAQKKRRPGSWSRRPRNAVTPPFKGFEIPGNGKQVVQPMIEKREDQLYGFTAMAEAFGWGDLKVMDIQADERLVIRVSDSYEAMGYLKRYGKADSGKCYMLQGVAAAFMDLLYGEDYPEGCFTFVTDETLCRAKGDLFCEFVAKKRL